MKKYSGKFLWLALIVAVAMIAAVIGASAEVPSVAVSGSVAFASPGDAGTVKVSYSDATDTDQVYSVGVKLTWDANKLNYVQSSAEGKLTAEQTALNDADASSGELRYNVANGTKSVITEAAGEILTAKFEPTGNMQAGETATVNIAVTSWGSIAQGYDAAEAAPENITVTNGAVTYSSTGEVHYGDEEGQYADPAAALNAAYEMTAQGMNVTLYMHKTMTFTEEVTIGNSQTDTSEFGTVTVQRADGVAADDAKIVLNIPGEYKNVKIFTNITFNNLTIDYPDNHGLTDVGRLNAIVVLNSVSYYKNVFCPSNGSVLKRPIFIGNKMTFDGAASCNPAIIAGNRYKSGVTVDDSNVSVTGKVWAQNIVGGSYNGSVSGANMGAVTGNVTLDISGNVGVNQNLVGGSWYSNNYAADKTVTVNIDTTGQLNGIYLAIQPSGEMPRSTMTINNVINCHYLAPVKQNSDTGTADNVNIVLNSVININGGTFSNGVNDFVSASPNNNNNQSKVEGTSELNISGGTFNCDVVGGYRHQANAETKFVESSLNAAVNISGGTFARYVTGGSYGTAAAKLVSTGTSNLVITGGKFNGDVIGNSYVVNGKSKISGDTNVTVSIAEGKAVNDNAVDGKFVGNCVFAAGSDGAQSSSVIVFNMTRGRINGIAALNSDVESGVKNITVSGSLTANISGIVDNRTYQTQFRNTFYGGHMVNADAGIVSTGDSAITVDNVYFQKNIYNGSLIEGEAVFSGSSSWEALGGSSYENGSFCGGSRVGSSGVLTDSADHLITLKAGKFGAKVTVNDKDTYPYSVIGGSDVEGELNLTGAKFNLDIQGGTYNANVISVGSFTVASSTVKADSASELHLGITGGTFTKGKIYSLGYYDGKTEILGAKTEVNINGVTTPELLVGGIYSYRGNTVLNHTGTLKIANSTPKTTVYCGSMIDGTSSLNVDKQVSVTLENINTTVNVYGGEYFLSSSSSSSSGKVEINASGNTYTNNIFYGSRINSAQAVYACDTVISIDGDAYPSVYGGSYFESKSAGGGEHSGKTTISMKNTAVKTYCMAGSWLTAASLHSGDSELTVLSGCSFGNNNSIYGASYLNADNAEHRGNSKVIIDCGETTLYDSTAKTSTAVHGGCMFGYKGKMTGNSSVEFKSGTAQNTVIGGSLFNNWSGKASTFTGGFGHYGSSGVVVEGGTLTAVVGGSLSAPNSAAAYKADQLLTVGTAGADTEQYVELRGGNVTGYVYGGSWTSNEHTANITVNANTRLSIFDVNVLKPAGARTYSGGSKFYKTADVQNGNAALIFEEGATGAPVFGNNNITMAGGLQGKGTLNGNSSFEIKGTPTLALGANKLSGGCIGDAANAITHNGGSKLVIGGEFTWASGDLHAMGVNSNQDNGDVELVINGNVTAPANIIGVSWKNILHGNTRIVVNAPLTLANGTIMAGAYGGKLIGNSTLEINADVTSVVSYIYAGSHGTSALVHDPESDAPYHTVSVSGTSSDYDFRQVGDVTIKVTNGAVSKAIVGQGQYSFQKGNVNIDITGGTLYRVAAFFNANGAAVSNYGYLEGNVTAYVGGTASFTYDSTATGNNLLSAGAFSTAGQNNTQAPKVSYANYVNGNVDLTIGGAFKILGSIFSAGGTGCSGTHRIKFVGDSFDFSKLKYIYTSSWTGANAVAPGHSNTNGTFDLSEVTLPMDKYTAWFCQSNAPGTAVGNAQMGGSSNGGWANVIPALMDAKTFELKGEFKKAYNLGESLDLSGAAYAYAVEHPVYVYNSSWKSYASADISAADITSDTARTYVNSNGKTLTNGKLGAFTTNVNVVLINGLKSATFDVTVALPEGTTNIGHVGTSIRLSEPRGLRYKADINTALLSAAKETDGFVIKKVGTLIAKTATLNGQTALLENAGRNEETGKYLIMDIPVYDVDTWGTEKFITSAVRTEGDEEYREFAVVLTGIKTLAHYSTEISFRPYMLIEDEYGDTATFYSTFPDSSAEPVNGSLSMSIKAVADMITDEDYNGYTDDQKAYIDNIRNNVAMEAQVQE